MRIGIVVPAEIIDEIITFLSGEFPEIEAVPFPYHSIVEIPDLLSGRQNSVETFLFLGDTARRYAEKAVPACDRMADHPAFLCLASAPFLPGA